MTSSARRSSSGRRTRKSTESKVMRLTSAKQVRALESLIRKGPMTVIFVYSPTCPHCHTYQPLWDELTGMSGKKSHMVSMKSDVYRQTPFHQKKPVNGVPSVLFVDPSGRISEGKNIRDKATMVTAVKNGVGEEEAVAINVSNTSNTSKPSNSKVPSPSFFSTAKTTPSAVTTPSAPSPSVTAAVEASNAEKVKELLTSDLFRVSEKPTSSEVRIPSPQVSEKIKSIIPGAEAAVNPLRPIPATPESSSNLVLTGGARVPQQGGNPWAAFLLAAQQAAPAAALLGAYSALPHRSSGLGKAIRRRTRKQKRRSK